MSQNPNLDTHVAELGELPENDHGQLVGRPDLPVPSLWQERVKLKHKRNGTIATIFRVDHSTCMFRPYFPDEKRLATRTEWENFKDWEIQVTYSPTELARQAAAQVLEDEIAKLDARSIGLARVLCDDPDPSKALAKMQLLVQSGMLTPMSVAAAEAVIADAPVPVADPPIRRRAKPEPKPES